MSCSKIRIQPSSSASTSLCWGGLTATQSWQDTDLILVWLPSLCWEARGWRQCDGQRMPINGASSWHCVMEKGRQTCSGVGVSAAQGARPQLK
eukprot:2667617-Rhodomonas_salina.2